MVSLSRSISHGLFVLALGLALGGAASPEEQRAQAEQQQTAKATAKSLEAVSATLKDMASPNVEDAPCGDRKKAREYDLCAQWQAADAADRSAIWTMRGVWVGGLTLVAAAFAAFFAWRAAVHTATGAQATKEQVAVATDANAISRDAAVLQTRPWLDVKLKLRERAFENTSARVIGLWAYAQNVGTTPAHNVRLAARLVPHGPVTDLAKVQRDIIEEAMKGGFTASPVLFPEKVSMFRGVDVPMNPEGPHQVPRVFVCAAYKVAGDTEDRITLIDFTLVWHMGPEKVGHLRDAPNGPIEVEMMPGGGIAT